MHTKLIIKLRQEAALKSLPVFTRDLMREAANVIADYDIAELKPVVKAVWIKVAEISPMEKPKRFVKCSRCQKSFEFVGYFYDYCPKCGAEMWCDDEN